MIGTLYEEKSNLKDAIKCYNKAIDLSQDYLEPLIRLGKIFTENEALAEFSKYVDKAIVCHKKEIKRIEEYEVQKLKQLKEKINKAIRLREGKHYEAAVNWLNNAFFFAKNLRDEDKINKEQARILNHKEEIYCEKIQIEIDRAIALKESKKFEESVQLLNQILLYVSEIEVKNKTEEKERIAHYINNFIDETYQELIDYQMSEANKIRNQLTFDEALDNLNNILNMLENIKNTSIQNQKRAEIKNEINTIKAAKIKNAILDLGSKFGRLQVIEIAEECGESIDLIVSTVKEMIEGEEIYAKYFESSQAVAFDQQQIRENLNSLKDSIRAVVIPEETKRCIVCKGKIQHLLYECPQCKAYYHLKCAKALKSQRKKCFQCNEKFPSLPELPVEEVQEDPVVISVRKIKYQISTLLNPEDITHKDLSSQFAQLKQNLQEELIHKVSDKFHNSFESKIEDLFDKLLNLSKENLDTIEDIRKEQEGVFANINKKLEELQDARWFNSRTKKERHFCPECGNEIMEESQAICEECGLDLRQALKMENLSNIQEVNQDKRLNEKSSKDSGEKNEFLW